MYQKLNFLAMLFISIILFLLDQIYSQEQCKVVIINEGADDVTDSTTHKSFSPLKNFQPTVFFKLPDLQSSNPTDLFRITDFQNTGQKEEKPPLRSERIVGEIGVGTGCGILAGGIGFAIGAAITPAGEGQFGDLEKLAGGGIGFLIGYPLGNSIGVYLVGNSGNETGSFGTTLLGSMAGMVAAMLPIIIFQDDLPGWVGLPALFGFPIAGGVIGFNMTRSYKSPHDSGTALINFRDGQIKLATPTIYFRPNPFDKGDLIQNINLVKARF
jgi:hypothetical protein